MLIVVEVAPLPADPNELDRQRPRRLDFSEGPEGALVREEVHVVARAGRKRDRAPDVGAAQLAEDRRGGGQRDELGWGSFKDAPSVRAHVLDDLEHEFRCEVEQAERGRVGLRRCRLGWG